MRRALLTLLIVLLPVSARATAGFAEQHSQLRYNDWAQIHWIHPGDGCDCGKFCFQVVRKESRYQTFPGLERSLSKISVPQNARSSRVLAQRCCDQSWLVYDLASEQLLAETPSYEAALDVWKSAGSREPRIADAAHGAHGLAKTWSSFAEDWLWAGLLLLPVIVPAVFVVCGAAFLARIARFRRTRSANDLVWALVLFVPTLPGWWLAWVLISAMARRR